ncbi:MAG: SagB/ThcOx family dehydrogenase [Chloroflexi bacterium]|nr:SagB/ThcOx family dehydrogenase [Chloroflexota bacterium]
MKFSGRALILLALMPLSCAYGGSLNYGSESSRAAGEAVSLPSPKSDGPVPLEEALRKRRSVREFRDEPLSLEAVSQLLWAAQCITAPDGFRTAPSAGGTYPLEVYAVVGKVNGLEPGVYRYVADGHRLERVREGDLRDSLAGAALDQAAIREAPVDIVIAAVYARTAARYGDRGTRYVHLEAGHAAQNLCLQGVALGLGSVVIGAFYDEPVRERLGMPSGESPLYIVPVGRPAG